jgi:hypothetical protein
MKVRLATMTQIQERRLVNSIKIELDGDQIEVIIREELKALIEDYKRFYDEPDIELLKAARVIHNFYCKTEDHI